MYIVLLADVVASRDTEQRDDYLENIAAASKRFNQRYKGLPGKAERFNGDQIGVVFDMADIAACFNAALFLSHELWPHQLRIAIATGDVDAGLATRMPSKMDGPAFHKAAIALREQKARLFTFQHNNALLDGVISTLGNTTLQLLARCSDAEFQAIHAYNTHGSQTKAAKALSISRQAISKALQRADYALINEQTERAKELLASLKK